MTKAVKKTVYCQPSHIGLYIQHNQIKIPAGFYIQKPKSRLQNLYEYVKNEIAKTTMKKRGKDQISRLIIKIQYSKQCSNGIKTKKQIMEQNGVQTQIQAYMDY